VDVLGLQAYLNRLASAEPTPGGGSAAAVVGALGAALVAMVARITLGNPKHAPVHADALDLVAQADGLRAQLVAAGPADEAAYLAVVAAQALPRASAEERGARTQAVQLALAGAAEAPLAAAALAMELTVLCERAAALGNSHLMSDVACALAFAEATLTAAVANVRVNDRFITDAALVAAHRARIESLNAAAHASAGRARDVIDAV